MTVAIFFFPKYLRLRKSFNKCIDNFQSLALGKNYIKLLDICARNASGNGLPHLCHIPGEGQNKGRQGRLSYGSWWRFFPSSCLLYQGR